MGGLDGKRRGCRYEQKRPLIVRFNNFKDKSAVWVKSFELAGNDFSLNVNYSLATEYNHLSASKSKKNVEKYKKKGFSNGDVLIIDGKGYTVDNMQTIPRELHSRHYSEKKNDTHLMIVWRDPQCIQSTVKHSSLQDQVQ